MGVLRNIAKGLALFFFSLFLSLLILTIFFYNLTSYRNAKTLFVTIFKEVVMRNNSQKIEEAYDGITKYCSLKPNESVQLPEDIFIRCSEILDTNSSYLVYLIAEKSFDRLYFKAYECEMIECIGEIRSGEDFAIILSFKTHNFFNNLIQPLYLLAIVFGALLFLSLETWATRFKIFGFEFLSIGLFYFLLPYFKNFISEKFLREMSIGKSVLDLVFGQLSSIFLIFFISGLLLICVWLFLKFLGKKSK